MPVQNEQQKKKAICSMKQDLQLINCFSQHQFQADGGSFPRRIRTAKELSNVLSMKNRQLFFQERRYHFQKQQAKLTTNNHSTKNNLDVYSIKVLEERDRVIEEIKKKSKESLEQRGEQQICMSVIKAFNTSKMGQSMKESSIISYLQLLGLKEVAENCKISNDANVQNIEDLISCLKIMSNQSEQKLKVEKQSQKRDRIENIQNHRQTFKSMLNLRAEKKNLPLLELLKHKDISKKLKFTQDFSFLLNQMNKLLKNSQYNDKKCLNEQQYFFRNIALFDEKVVLQSDRYNQSLFWQKLCNLFLLGPTQYYHIEYLLNYKKQFGVLKHFKSLIQRKTSTIQYSNPLMAIDDNYKQFILMLKGEYLRQCLKKGSRDAQYQLMIGIREAIFLGQQSLPRDFHLRYLKKASQQKVRSLKLQLVSYSSESMLRKQVTKLFLLGQYAKTISLYFQYGKITYLQFLWLWGIIAEVDNRHSTILMYQQQKSCSLFKSKFRKIIREIKNIQELPSYYLLIKILRPCWLCDQLDKEYTIDLVTSNKLLLEYLVENVGSEGFLKSFGLEVTDIPVIVERAVQKHQDYAYCFQFTLSSVLNLEDLPKIVQNKRQQNQQTKVRPIRELRSSIMLYNVGKKYNQFQKLYLSIFLHCSQQFLEQNKWNRFSIFRSGFISLIKTNVFLLQNYKICDKKYQQISYVNKIYKSLNSTLAKKKMMQQFGIEDIKQFQPHQKQLDRLVDLLVLCSNMVKIRNSIRNRQFQYLVQSYNAILEDISDNFAQNITHLKSLLERPSHSTGIIYTFISDVIQSLLYLRQSKPRVIKSNNRCIYRFCKQIHSFTKHLNSRRGQQKLLCQSLQKFMRQIEG